MSANSQPFSAPRELYVTNFKFKREVCDGSEDSLLDVQIEQNQNLSLNFTAEISEYLKTYCRKFNILILNIRTFMDECLFTLRLEIRCHTIFYLDLAIREGSYFLDEEDPAPDPYIDTLNADLSSFEETMANSLPPRIQRFLFDGLSQLMCYVLMTNMRYIRRFNKNGVVRLVRNVYSLQQNLTNLVSIVDSDFSRVKTYTELAGKNGYVRLLNNRNFLTSLPRRKTSFHSTSTKSFWT
jgi:hypothetical protein